MEAHAATQLLKFTPSSGIQRARHASGYNVRPEVLKDGFECRIEHMNLCVATPGNEFTGIVRISLPSGVGESNSGSGCG
jgi:hypothetical protein